MTCSKRFAAAIATWSPRPIPCSRRSAAAVPATRRAVRRRTSSYDRRPRGTGGPRVAVRCLRRTEPGGAGAAARTRLSGRASTGASVTSNGPPGPMRSRAGPAPGRRWLPAQRGAHRGVTVATTRRTCRGRGGDRLAVAGTDEAHLHGGADRRRVRRRRSGPAATGPRSARRSRTPPVAPSGAASAGSSGGRVVDRPRDQRAGTRRVLPLQVVAVEAVLDLGGVEGAARRAAADEQHARRGVASKNGGRRVVALDAEAAHGRGLRSRARACRGSRGGRRCR